MGSTITAIVEQFVTTSVAVALINGLFVLLGRTWIEAKIKSRFDKALEDYRFELRAHEQGAKIAEYAAFAGKIQPNDPEEKYNRANQLALELFLWLPAEAYRKLGRGLKGNHKELVEAMVAVRKVLLKHEAGDLGPDDIIVHAPNIDRPPLSTPTLTA